MRRKEGLLPSDILSDGMCLIVRVSERQSHFADMTKDERGGEFKFKLKRNPVRFDKKTKQYRSRFNFR